MAALNIDDLNPNCVEIHENEEWVSISFRVGSDGIADVTVLCLSLQFQLNAMSLHIHEDVFDTISSNLIDTISQFLIFKGNGKY
jgi:hypothetical protein